MSKKTPPPADSRSQQEAIWRQDLSDEQTFRSYRRNLPQAQRDQLARLLWKIRREKRKGEAGFVGWYVDYGRD
jgi:hypothetical protein